jgi:integrase
MSNATPRKRIGRQRGPRVGWYIRERDGKLVAHAKDPHSHAYKAKTFLGTERAEAEKWAQDEAARMRLDTPKPVKLSLTSFRGISAAFMDALKLSRASDGHTAQVQAAIDATLEFGITDLAATDIVAETVKLLLSLKRQSGLPASDASRNNFLKHLRTIGNFAVRRRHIGHNPFQEVDYIPLTIELKEVFALDELRRILKPENASHPFYRQFASMAYTGFRLHEMVNLDWSWFMWDAKRIRMVIEKKDRARPGLNTVTPWQPKNKRARITRLMEEYAEIMQPKGATTLHATGPVFPDLKNYSNKALQSGFESLLKHAGVTVRGLTPHSCRHTWTALMLASGENEMLVQQYAGHSQKEMTAHYAQSQEEFRVQVAREGWARGELSLIAPPQCTVGTTKPTVTSASGVPH